MVMFTDGVTTVGGNADPIATEAKNKGVIIYCIGLNGNGELDVNTVNNWASDPSSAYVAITPDDEELEDLFQDLANNISKPGATNIFIEDFIDSCFKITSVTSPTKSSASIVNDTTIKWNIDELGVTQNEETELEFSVKHIRDCTGEIEVNEKIEYDDDQGNVVSFPSPTIEVDCGNTIIEECPTPVEFEVGGYKDSVEINAGEIYLNSNGKIIQVDATLKNVCPDRKIALSIILSTNDTDEYCHNIGMKVITIPETSGTTCRDITIKCIKFVVPHLDTNPAFANRKYKVMAIANYIDTDFCWCKK